MLDLTTPTRRPGDSLPLLGPAGGTLALKVCGGSHRGRVIQIRAPKCTIGSAAGCTLRLRATGVRPLHCWILRGPTGTVVRRCASGTLLNGLAYEDAPLRRGDRLRVGMVELEVVDCPERTVGPVSASVTQSFSADDSYFHDSKLRELELSLTAANDEIARLEADAQQAWQTSITAAERAEQLRLALEKSNVETGEMRGELETAQGALASERQQREQNPQLAELQQRLNETERKLAASAETQAKSARELADQAARFAGEREAFERQQLHLAETERSLAASGDAQARTARELAEQAARFASEREAVERQLEQLRRDVERARNQPAQQSAQMTITMDQIRAEAQAQEAQSQEAKVQLVQEWQDRCAVLEADLQRTRDELTAACQVRDAAGQWEVRFRDADRQVEHWQAEADGRRLHIEDLQQQLAAEKTRQSQADAAELQRLEDQRRELDQQREALAAREEQLSVARSGFAEFEAELKHGREALEAEQARQHAELDQQAARLQQRALDLDARAQELADRQTALEVAREQLAQGQAACESRQQQLAASEAELIARRDQLTAGHTDLAAAREALAAGQAELVAARDALAAAGPELTAQRNELAAQREALTAGQAELEQERERLQRWVDEMQAEADEAARRQQPVSSAAATMVQPATPGEEAAWGNSAERAITDSDSQDLNGVDSVLGRLVQSGRWRDHLAADQQSPEQGESSEPVLESPAAQPEPEAVSALPPAATPAPLTGELEGQDEESIETYMERLMQRVRGDSTSPPKPAIVPVLQKQIEELAAEAPIESVPSDEPVKPEEYLPRSQAPEQSANLAAMREVANTAARTAIEQHHQKSGNKQVAFRLLGAGVLLLGSALLGYWAWQMSSITAAVGAGIGLLTGSLWALRGFVRMLCALKLSRPQPAAAEGEPAAAIEPHVPDDAPVAAELASEAEPGTK